MVTKALSDVIKKAEKLTPEDQLSLIAHLAEKARQAYSEPRRRKWSEISGVVPYPALGSDAQAEISRSRQESDEQRAAK